MDVVGSEIGQKMRSAIKAKLTELGCYVDDELPDYVMVMVANKRTRAQMEDDLQLFLGDNTELFVNWLHQVLKKLQEVTVSSVPLKTDITKSKERSQSKERKQKEKKDKEKTKTGESSKKAKKKEKEKSRKKEGKKSHKSKKKSKHHEIIRPNIPPLLMNMEKESEPSITDVFAGQILKNHGVLLEPYKEEETKQLETKVLKRPIVPIIDPETITTPEASEKTQTIESDKDAPTNEQIKDVTEIETRIQGLRGKLLEQLDSLSDDEDFLNIRTEAEELMNDFGEDVSQEVTQPPPATPPLHTRKIIVPPIVGDQKPQKEIETLPQIELNLPKRPIRERLGAKEVPKVQETKETEKTKETAKKSPERFTPDKDLVPKSKSARSRLGSQSERQRKSSISEDSSEKLESNKRLTSKVSVLSSRSGTTRASVVRVRPRPRVGAPASSLLLRAVADAHKSLLNIPPKVDVEPPKIKRALVLPMRRVEAHKIVIQVPVDRPTCSDNAGDGEGDERNSKIMCDIIEKEFRPTIMKVINNTEYIPNKASEDDDTIVDSSTIHNAKVNNKDKGTQFIVTMDGYHPNAFLAKKLKTEGLLEDDEREDKPKDATKPEEKEKATKLEEKEKETVKEKIQDKDSQKESAIKDMEKFEDEKVISTEKGLSNTSEKTDTQVIIKEEPQNQIDKRKSEEESIEKKDEDTPPVKKRRASPIIFDVDKKKKEKENEQEKEKESVRERTISASSDSVTLTTSLNSNKYDSLPPLSQAERKLIWCRAFPLCRYGAACAFAHPRCKFAAACTRRGCVYSHAPGAPVAPSALLAPLAATEPPLALASHVVPAANYKSISASTPSMCKFYPNCVNPACHFYHPKICRFGKACANKLECNFYHQDLPKWKYSL